MSFKDHFSRQADAYSRFRPEYPAALIDFVVAQAPGRRLALDCATGNGQAAVALGPSFEAVLGVDASLTQLARAQRHPRVHYAASLAERLPLSSGTVDLVAVAQAAHWFRFDVFHAECRRVLVPGGVVACWTYEKFRVDAAIDAIVDEFYVSVIGRYWPPERAYVQAGYRTLPFPWHEIPAPVFVLETDWTLDQLTGYLGTWSAVQRYKDDRGDDPLPALEPLLARHWPAAGTRRLRWPIHLRVGRA